MYTCHDASQGTTSDVGSSVPPCLRKGPFAFVSAVLAGPRASGSPCLHLPFCCRIHATLSGLYTGSLTATLYPLNLSSALV